MPKFKVDVYARSHAGDRGFVGSTDVEADDDLAAEVRAHERIWDPWLAASASPEYEVQDLEVGRSDSLDCTSESFTR